MTGKLAGIRFSNAGDQIRGGVPLNIGGDPLLVVVDGLEMGQRASIDFLNADNVETIEVLKGVTAGIYGSSGSNGVLVITTQKVKPKSLKDISSHGILPITVQGYQKMREFYSPKYENNITYNHPDLRSTIYWKPEVTTDKGGNASFDFYNADGTGNYRVVVEGIDEKGNLGRQTFTYKVQ